MTLFGLAALIAPVVGPTLGGWITNNYSWRWVFYINLPVGALAWAACYAVLEDPDYLKAERLALQKQPLAFDSIGLGLLVIAVVCWEITLSKGEEWDWLGDPFGRIQTLLVLFLLALGGLVVWELRRHQPVVNLRPMAERNFAISCVLIFCAYLILYGYSTTLPSLLESLFGYDALNAGLVMSPSGLFAVSTLPVVAFVIGRGTDARWLIAAGLLVIASGNYWMSLMNLTIGPGQAMWPRVVMIVGLSMTFAPLNVAAYLYTPHALRGAAVGLFSLLRNEGGSAGTSLAQSFQYRLDQFLPYVSVSISTHSIRLSPPFSWRPRTRSCNKRGIL